MLFLDDDIRWLNADKLNVASAGLKEYPVVGLQVSKHPDLSVIGHARRLTGDAQKPFISGGSLLLNPQRLNGFFPIRVEFALPVFQFCAANPLERRDRDAVDPYIP